MFSAAKPNASGAKIARNLCIMGCIGVGAHMHAGHLVAQIHQFAEIAAEFGIFGFNFAFINFAG
jgi:hypothetical protein